MWIFTRDGFFSIVQHKDWPDYLVVRAREREDIQSAFGPDDIVESDESDYRFRVTLPRALVTDYLSKTIAELDYTSVKDNITKGEEDRHRMLYQVWDNHFRFQQDRYPTGDRFYDEESDWYDLTWTFPPSHTQ